MNYRVRIVGGGDPVTVTASSAKEAASVFAGSTQLPESGWVLVADAKCDFTQFEIRGGALVKDGLVTSAKQPKRQLTADEKRARRRSAIRSMLYGTVLFVIGLAVTVGSFLAASESSSSGQFTVAIGAMAWGFAYFVIGAFRLFTKDTDA